ncbi:hypothetical protein ACHAXM_009943 [Skeletonema potamos]
MAWYVLLRREEREDSDSVRNDTLASAAFTRFATVSATSATPVKTTSSSPSSSPKASTALRF